MPGDFADGYWKKLWDWYAAGGIAHVAAYLTELDISTFDPKAPPPKTDAFWAIVDANRAPEDAELADVLDQIKNPKALTLSWIRSATSDESFKKWLSDRRNSRAIPHRLETCGYIAVRNPDNDRGFWVVDGRKQVIYAQRTLSLRDQIAAAQALSKSGMPL